MSITGAFMVPHPPIMLPDVGRGEEKKIEKTTAAYMQVAERIAELKPDTIVISSPHSIMYADYFHISPGRSASGDMSQFNAGEISISVEYDTELVDEICSLATHYGSSDSSEIQDFPAGTMGERNPKLDHGTLIPLYYILKKYQDFKLVRIGLSGLPLAMHYEMGMIIQKAASNCQRRVVFVASGDLSHKMKEDGPYGYAAEGPEYDKKIMEVCSQADFIKLLDFDENFCDKAAECGHRSFVMMAGALDGLAVSGKELSHEATFGVGYGICSFEVGGEDDSRHFLDTWKANKLAELNEHRKNEDIYVKAARFSLESYILNGIRVKKEDLRGESWADIPDEMLEKEAGAFVSIHKEGQLRGCIGTIMPTCESVLEEILQNAISAAVNDPRFPAITSDELPYLEMSVDVLSEPEPIESKEMLDVKRYGVIVTNGQRRGLLLPNLDGVDTIDEQISIARRKAGIREDETVALERFEVVRHL